MFRGGALKSKGNEEFTELPSRGEDGGLVQKTPVLVVVLNDTRSPGGVQKRFMHGSVVRFDLLEGSCRSLVKTQTHVEHAAFIRCDNHNAGYMFFRRTWTSEIAAGVSEKNPRVVLR